MTNSEYYYKYIKYKTKYISSKKNNKIKINLKPKKINNSENSFNIVSKYFNKTDKKYLNYELIKIIKSNSPTEYNRKNKEIYDDKKFKLFNMEDFLNSKWSFLDELLEKYQEKFDSSKWFNNLKLSKEEFDDPKNYPVYLQKLKINDNSSKFCIIGDIHSSLHSLISIIESIKDDYFINDNLKLKPNRYIFFLGDILDRGPYNMEVLFIVLSLKNINFENIVIMDGNHEDHSLFSNYDTVDEYQKQFKSQDNVVNFVDSKINKILNRLCTCLYLEFNNKRYHLSHGAFDSIYAGFKEGKKLPDDKNFHLQTNLYKFLESNDNYCLLDKNNNSTNYKWGDFNNEIDETKISSRGSGIFKYSVDLTRQYLTRFKISNIFTGHQDREPINFLINKRNNKYNMIKSKKYDLYQPSKLQPFSLNDDDFLALTTSTATIPRKMNVEGIYIELSN